MPRSARSCCVVGCRNSEANTAGQNIRFHTFPGKAWEKERLKAWIIAVRRLKPDGTLWTPTKNSRVCSVHFVGGKKSDIQNHPSYVPSIFPAAYKKRPPKSNAISRFERTIKRRKLISSTNTCLTSLPSTSEIDSSSDVFVEVIVPKEPQSKNISTQAAFPFDQNYFTFTSEILNNNACTQASIGRNLFKNTLTYDKACGTDNVNNENETENIGKQNLNKKKKIIKNCNGIKDG